MPDAAVAVEVRRAEIAGRAGRKILVLVKPATSFMR
tara:strand:+ start:345 stop:452 length:108 start_codon:yes stop_codon:yes gene_type:complete